MSAQSTESRPGNQVVRHLLETLRRHPKRVVFTEGEDIRVLEAAARLVREEVVAPILLGNRDRIRALAADHDIPLTFIKLIDPPLASDFGLFCQRVENMDRYRSRQLGKADDLVSRPHYFGSLMVQYGQADAIVGGNQAMPASFFRALLHMIKPLPHVPKIFGVTVLIGPHLSNLGSSGILLLAKKRSALLALQAQFRQRETTKVYAALVAGDWPARLKVIDLPLLRTTDTAGERHVRVSAPEVDAARRSITLVRVVRRIRLLGLPFSLLDVTIKTGRTHQIRVHLAHHGHPIAGDPKYGDFALNRRLAREAGFDRMFLHARALALAHPADGRRIELESALPAECQALLDAP